MFLMDLLSFYYLDTYLAGLCTVMLAVAVIRGAPRVTLVLFCGCLLITSSAFLPHYLAFEMGEHARTVGWLLVAIYCMTLLRTRTTNGDATYSTPPIPLRSRTSTTAMLGLAVGIAANCPTIFFALSLLALPRGAAIRPMAFAMLLLQLALGALILGVPLSAIGCFQSRAWHRLWGVLGILLCLGVLPIAVGLLQAVAYVAGLTWDT
jgi:hypothetical protein